MQTFNHLEVLRNHDKPQTWKGVLGFTTSTVSSSIIVIYQRYKWGARTEFRWASFLTWPKNLWASRSFLVCSDVSQHALINWPDMTGPWSSAQLIFRYLESLLGLRTVPSRWPDLRSQAAEGSFQLLHSLPEACGGGKCCESQSLREARPGSGWEKFSELLPVGVWEIPVSNETIIHTWMNADQRVTAW